MSFAFHKEIIKNSSVNHILTGKFIESQYRPQNKTYALQQILFVRKNRFEIYDIDEQNNYIYLHEYKLFGDIVTSEKMRLEGRSTDIVILALDYAKIVFLEYNEICADFKILCLYNLENENLSNGKRFYSQQIKLISSETYGCVFVVSNDIDVTILIKKEQSNQVDYDIVLNEEDQIKYVDTVNGENYFEPSFYVNLREYGVLRIIKFYVANKENEILDYTNLINPVPDDAMVIQILHIDPSLSNPDKDQNNNKFFMKNKVSLSLAYISKTNKNVVKFDNLCDNLDEHSFDIFCLTNSKMIVVPSPYVLQYINHENRQCVKIVLNNIYIAVLNNHQNVDTQLTFPSAKHDVTYSSYNLDLRGGGYLILSQTMFLFSDSKGMLFLFTFGSDKQFTIDRIVLSEAGQPVYSLNSPYRYIVMPNPGLFILTSYHSDVIFIQYTSSNEYLIVNRMLNLSPIVTFNTLQNSLHPSYNNIKFVITNGYDKNSQMNFLFDKLTSDTVFQKELQEVGYMKSIKFDTHTKYLVMGLTSGTTSILSMNSMEELTDPEVNRISKLLYCFTIDRKIGICYDKLVELHDEDFKLLQSLDFNNIDKSDIIKQAKQSGNILVLFTYNENLYSVNLESFEYNKILPYAGSGKVLTFTSNKKPIDGMKFLLLYRENNSLEIYNLDNLNQGIIFRNELISELPVIISDTSLDTTLSDLKRSTSDISTIVEINNNTFQHGICQSTPEEFFFDQLGYKTVFSMTFTNGTVVFYDVYFIDGSIKMKKFYVDFIENIDYRDFFYSVI
jgi:hypothetical protein